MNGMYGINLTGRHREAGIVGPALWWVDLLTSRVARSY